MRLEEELLLPNTLKKRWLYIEKRTNSTKRTYPPTVKALRGVFLVRFF